MTISSETGVRSSGYYVASALTADEFRGVRSRGWADGIYIALGSLITLGEKQNFLLLNRYDLKWNQSENQHGQESLVLSGHRWQ